MKKKTNLIYWYIFLVIYMELIYKLFVWNEIFNLKSLTTIFYSIPFAFVFYFLTNLWKEKINKILSIILTLFITIIFVSQFIYYQFYKSIFSIFSITEGTGQVFGEFGGVILEYIVRYFPNIIIIFIPFIFLSIYGKKLFNYKREDRKTNLILLTTLIILYIFNGIFLLFDKDSIYSNYRLQTEIHSPILTINRMGLLTMEKLDIKRYIFSFNEKMYNYKKEDFKDLSNEEKLKKYNMINIDFKELIKNEKDENIKEMHEYFNNIIPSEKNEYTGMFKNKNLIFITAESLDISAIKENITPTLYKIMNSSFVFKNYYQPLYPVSTLDGEYMNMTSLIPKEGTWSFYKSSEIYMPYGIGNVFKNLNYEVKGYHNHSYNYYHRELSHTNIGLDYIGCGNGLEKKINCNIFPESDLEMINSTIEDYINKDKFVAYYMTVSGHLRYNKNNAIASKNWDNVKNLDTSDSIKAYYATNIELDKAVEVLIKKLKDSEKLDDTLIVIAPDHYPYGLTIGDLNKISERERNDKFELYNTSLIMYNSKLNTKIIEDYVSGIDILPTIYNLFGIEYDSRLLMGRDILSKSEKIVVLSDRSWITNKGKYDSITGIFTPFKENIDKEYVNNINNKVNQKFALSSYILDTNYYNKLGVLK